MNRFKSYVYLVFGVLVGLFLMYFFNNYKIEKVDETGLTTTEETRKIVPENIDVLTAERTVIDYIKENHQLPDYYITKQQAREKGWIASHGNLCEVLPGKAIGGDRFSNRERKLPPGEQYYEADVNYDCGKRNVERVVFTGEGEVWLTKDHYKTFKKQ